VFFFFFFVVVKKVLRKVPQTEFYWASLAIWLYPENNRLKAPYIVRLR